jgi:aminomethyltransferase
MLAVEVIGEKATEFLRYVLANDVVKLKPGKALYTCMLNEKGGILDDLIVYFMNPERYRIVVNAGRRDHDINWLTSHAKTFGVSVEPQFDLAILAVQGPEARELAKTVLPADLTEAALALTPFSCTEKGKWFVGRTGYTGEDGFELMMPATEASFVWDKLLQAGVKPCGLGARDTLRLEAGMNLYGVDMNESLNPLETGLAWTVSMGDRDFIGKSALQALKVAVKQVGLVLLERGVLRGHQKIIVPEIGEGEITSGTFSPTLGLGVAMARVPVATEIGSICQVVVRDKPLNARVVKLPFVRFGKKIFDTSGI